MSPIRGRRALLFRLVAIPTAALLASHFILYQRFPGQPGYHFPTIPFLTIAAIMTACWEVNMAVFRRLDKTLPFQQNPLRRLGRQVLEGSLFTALTFVLVFGLISVIGYGTLPSATGLFTGLFICFGIATIINGVYVGLYLVDVIYWQKHQPADFLNAQLVGQQALLIETDDAIHVNQDQLVMDVARSALTGVFVDAGNQTLQLHYDEIAYVYSTAGIIQIMRQDGRKLTTNYDSLTPLQTQLPASQFFQINRQFIVHLSAIRSVQDAVNRKLTIRLVPALSNQQTDECVTISRYRSAEFRQWLTSVAVR